MSYGIFCKIKYKIITISKSIFIILKHHTKSPQEGRLSLTNEEIIALKSEHQEISFQLPLNQRDLMCLKRVRRKIRNKVGVVKGK